MQFDLVENNTPEHKPTPRRELRLGLESPAILLEQNLELGRASQRTNYNPTYKMNRTIETTIVNTNTTTTLNTDSSTTLE